MSDIAAGHCARCGRYLDRHPNTVIEGLTSQALCWVCLVEDRKQSAVGNPLPHCPYCWIPTYDMPIVALLLRAIPPEHAPWCPNRDNDEAAD